GGGGGEGEGCNDWVQWGAELAGPDALGVARPSGLRRLVSVAQAGNQGGGRQSGAEVGQSSIQSSLMVVYQTSQRAEPLTEWYMKEMPLAGWSLNQPAGQSKEKVQGALNFTKDNRSCLVWIKSRPGSDQTSVVISARAM